MVERVTKYRSSDGKEHNSFQAAQAHEAKMRHISTMAQVFNDQRVIPGNGNLAPQIFANPELLAKLRDACNKGLEWHRNSKKS
jgi:hypothetical protein